ncbi:ADP-ribosylglycohydrolase family protein [Zooshikella sp. RANM57]|uniref:ADP-ribosylglycohydrolase family protein n=1 Tax=Zooshikella sp. RANM57 TaxID=3425863 RepID=UPI003D700A1B
MKLNQYQGCFMGLALGDALGASYEGGIIERLLWKLIGRTKDGLYRYTDDTQMSLDVADTFLKYGAIDQNTLAKAFANSYRWSRGYGPAAASLLKQIRCGAEWHQVNRKQYKEGSLGNGAAMRAPIVALCFPHDEVLMKESVKKVSEITHAHPLAIEGAELIAHTVLAALKNKPIASIVLLLSDWCTSREFSHKIDFCINCMNASEKVKKDSIKKTLGNGITATESCITAIYYGLKYRDDSFESMLSDIFNLGGDTDTIGAMAGAIWGAFNGVDSLLSLGEEIENSEYILNISHQLYETVCY